MLRLLKTVAWLGVLAMVPSAAQAFSLVIPPTAEPWQVHDLGYQLTGDIVGPANLGEDFRRNTPVIYYAFDENFIDYFGSNGVWAVDQAFAILNNLKPASSYSTESGGSPARIEALQSDRSGLEPHGPEIGGAHSYGGANGLVRFDSLDLDPAQPASRGKLPGG